MRANRTTRLSAQHHALEDERVPTSPPSGLRDPASWLVATIDDQHAIGPEGRHMLLELGTAPRPHLPRRPASATNHGEGRVRSGGHSSRHLTSPLTVRIHLRKRWSARR
jgi:hypothetical protein